MDLFLKSYNLQKTGKSKKELNRTKWFNTTTQYLLTFFDNIFIFQLFHSSLRCSQNLGKMNGSCVMNLNAYLDYSDFDDGPFLTQVNIQTYKLSNIFDIIIKFSFDSFILNNLIY